MPTHDLARWLGELARTEPDRAGLAEAVIDWLTAGEGVEAIDLGRVMRFAWYELPIKWLDGPEVHRRALEVAADLFDHLDLPGYAAVCRSPVTASIHEAYAESDETGAKAFAKAYRESGIDPPDLEGFAWGDVMGTDEAVARDDAERALELAIASGRFVPGRRGWKAAAAEVTAAVLDEPDALGQTRRHAVLTERLHHWLLAAEHRSPELHALRARYANRLLHPIPVPADATERLEPVMWFLDSVEPGARLTAAGFLPTLMVRDAWERFDWQRDWIGAPPRSESDFGQLFELRQLLQRVGAIYTRAKVVRPTATGTRMGRDLGFAWRSVATGLSGFAWVKAVAEAHALLLMEGERFDDDLEDRVLRMMAEMGWRHGDQPPDRWALMSAWHATRRPLEALGGIEAMGDWRHRRTLLTDFGRATLLEQIRVTATGPASTVL